MTEGKLIDQAGDVGNGKVVVRLTVISLDAETVLRRRSVAFE